MLENVKVMVKHSATSSGCKGSDLILCTFSTTRIKENVILLILHKSLQPFHQI